jgi:NSS family neurotransmitter:Na+ symporter
VGKVVKYTVFIPVLLLLVMAVRSFTLPGAVDGLEKMWVPDFSAFSNASLWADAIGQVFFSLSLMMAIMFAYGSFLDRKSSIAADATIIAICDIGISLLAGTVMFTTMSATGQLDSALTSGITAAFIVYPQSIVLLSDSSTFNAIFGIIFYLTLSTLAVDSAFSIVEGTTTAISDKFRVSHKKTTIVTCIIAGIISLWFTTRSGLAWLDIVDNWTNQFNLLIVGIFECIAVGWLFKTSKVLDEVNKNTKGYQIPSFWFHAIIKVLAPLLLITLVVWNIATYITSDGGYGGYPMWAQIIGGWSITILAFISGFIIKFIAKKKGKDGDQDEKTWDEAE